MRRPARKNLTSRFSLTAAAVAALFLCALAFLSCDLFNKPLQDFLDEWTNIAKIMKHSFDGSYPVTGGLTNLPSGGGRVITYYLVNPQNYVLTPAATFASGGLTQGSDYSIEQDASDRTVLRLTLNNTYLQSLDGGGTEISPTVTITEPNSGRNFGSYSVPLRVNSAPPVLSNAVIMKYTDTGTEKYAVCFNLPAMDATDIHRDITRITVDGTFNNKPFSGTYQVTGGGTGTVIVDGVPESLSSDYQAIGSEFVDMGNKFVGIKTGLDLGSVTPSCRVTLTDSSGATSVTTVSTANTLLDKIYVDGGIGDDNNTGTINSPVKTIAAALDKLRDVPNGSVILQSDINLDEEVTVDFGVSVTVTGDVSGRTVTNSNGRVFTVNSGGSLTLRENITLTGKNNSADGGAVYVNGGNFTMESGSKITGSSASRGGGVFVAASGNFTMSGDVAIKGNEATGSDGHGGGVCVSGGTFTVSGTPTITGNTVSGSANNVYLYTGIVITIGGTLSDTARIGVNTEGTPGVTGIKITDKNVAEAANIFTSDAGYTIVESVAPMEDAVYLSGSGAEVVYSSAGNVTFGSFKEACDKSATEIALLKDITSTTASGLSWPIEFSWTCTLDLNGHAIDRGLGSATDNGQVIVIISNGNLTIKDSSVTQPDGTGGKGMITGGYDSGDGIDYRGGGGIYIGGGSLTLESGSITSNKTEITGGGVYVSSSCTFNMSGGTIRGNSGNIGGGVSSNGTFNMSNGTISGNNSKLPGGGGGGVVVYDGNFEMTGGTIGGKTEADANIATVGRGGGVYLFGGTFTMSTGALITGNKATLGIDTPGGGVSVRIGDDGGTFNQGTGTVTGNTPDNVSYW